MDFGTVPPEIHSALMYAGPGAGPMIAAAAAWDQLATTLRFTAASFRSEISGLVDESWQGPSSIAMESATAPYVTWIGATAAQCEHVASQAKAAASAYETAFTTTVPPPLIAANRAQRATLVATNLLGCCVGFDPVRPATTNEQPDGTGRPGRDRNPRHRHRRRHPRPDAVPTDFGYAELAESTCLTDVCTRVIGDINERRGIYSILGSLRAGRCDLFRRWCAGQQPDQCSVRPQRDLWSARYVRRH
jgi:hypothetical protein